MLKIAIIDDEVRYIDLIKVQIANFYDEINRQYEISYFTSAQNFLQNCHEFDIVFLDVEIPVKNGLEIKAEMERQCYRGNIVFVTNYDDFISDAIGRNVIAYIHKNNMDRIYETLNQIEFTLQGNKIIEISGSPIYVNDILYMEANNGYTSIYTKKENYITSSYLSDVYKKIKTTYFAQVHRSYVLNLRYVKFFTSTEITMIDETIIPLSRKNKSKFKDAFYSYMMEF